MLLNFWGWQAVAAITIIGGVLGSEYGPYPQYGWDFPEEIAEKFRKDPGNASERFLEFSSRVRLGSPKPYNSEHLRLPEHFQNSLPPQHGWGRLFFQNWFRRGPFRAGHGIPSSTEGISESKRGHGKTRNSCAIVHERQRNSSHKGLVAKHFPLFFRLSRRNYCATFCTIVDRSLRNDNKISRQEILHFPSRGVSTKSSVLDDFPFCPQGLPLSKSENSIFIFVSPSLSWT